MNKNFIYRLSWDSYTVWLLSFKPDHIKTVQGVLSISSNW